MLRCGRTVTLVVHADDVKCGTPASLHRWVYDRRSQGGHYPGEVERVERDNDGRIVSVLIRDESTGKSWTFWDLGDGMFRGVASWSARVGERMAP